MTLESTLWFAGQLVGTGAAALLGWRLGRAHRRVWQPAAIIAAVLTLLWPLMRLRPLWYIHFPGPAVVIFIEVTGVILPAALLFALASARAQRPRERRALRLLIVVCVLYLVRNGLWMVRPEVPDLRTATYADRVCRQSTDYTCVAASLVTLLDRYGIPATETEMARLSYTEPGNGTTDTRAVYALQRKLAGTRWTPCYERCTYARFMELPQPSIVALRWGYFTSHMVPVLAATPDGVDIGDPLTGPRHLSPAEFQAEWLHRVVYLRTQPD